MAARVINIDFDRILNVALVGVRRASVFMGLGVNAAIDPGFRSFQLSSLTQIQLLPDNISDETIGEFKDEFRLWIEAAGLRELSEAFAVFLDEVHLAGLLLQAGRPSPELNESQLRFRSEGLPNKLNVLRQRFNVEPKHADFLVLMSRARNCLAHRRGLVGPEDLRPGETELAVRWLGIDFFVEVPDGTRHSLNQIPEGGLHLPEGGAVKMQFLERVRQFPLHAKLQLSTRDLAEICWFYEHEAKVVIQSAIQFAQTRGIEVRRIEN